MIFQNVNSTPGFRNGFNMTGIGTSAATSGYVDITIKGQDKSAKLCAVATVQYDSSSLVYVAELKSISYAANVTTVRFIVYALTAPDPGVLTKVATAGINIHYFIWADNYTLPTDSTVNNTNNPGV